VIHDLASDRPPPQAGLFDVAVVGAGIAGSILACELASAGKRVVLLESGGRAQESDTHPLNRVVQVGAGYRGAEHGRFRCLGGTSTRWGGALIPFRREDVDPAWPIRHAELVDYLPRAEALFSLPAGDYELPDAEHELIGAAAPFRIRAAKWPTFARRNVARLLEAPLQSAQGPDVWLNATLTAIRLGEDGRVQFLEARGPGAKVQLRAREVVLAAGAIESTRLLLKLDADHGRQVFNGHDVLGRYFHDHLSAPMARIVAPRRQALTRLTGFRFEASGMRNVRFELDRASPVHAGLPGTFVHVVCEAEAPGGFDALRGIYRAVQRRAWPASQDLLQLARHSGWFARAAWTRVAERRVLPPDDGRFDMHVVTEQRPVPGNRITLSDTERDEFGTPLAHIDWRVSDADIAGAEAVLGEFARFWAGRPCEKLGRLEVDGRDCWAGKLAGCGGIYHPGGSARMGTSTATAVVDRDLRVFGVPNLRVLSTAVFPTGGSANPTLTLILLALRTAEQLRRT